jgi:hypothetical protein
VVVVEEAPVHLQLVMEALVVLVLLSSQFQQQITRELKLVHQQ